MLRLETALDSHAPADGFRYCRSSAKSFSPPVRSKHHKSSSFLVSEIHRSSNPSTSRLLSISPVSETTYKITLPKSTSTSSRKESIRSTNLPIPLSSKQLSVNTRRDKASSPKRSSLSPTSSSPTSSPKMIWPRSPNYARKLRTLNSPNLSSTLLNTSSMPMSTFSSFSVSTSTSVTLPLRPTTPTFQWLAACNTLSVEEVS